MYGAGQEGELTYGHGSEKNPRAREEMRLVEALPYRVPTPFAVRVQRDLRTQPCQRKLKEYVGQSYSPLCRTRTCMEIEGRSWCIHPAARCQRKRMRSEGIVCPSR